MQLHHLSLIFCAYICACNTTPLGKFTVLCFAQSIHLYKESEKNLHVKCQDRSSIFVLRIASMILCFKEHHQVESLLFTTAFFPFTYICGGDL